MTDQQNPQDLTQLVTHIEEELLDIIMQKMETQKMSIEVAQQFARDFLSLLPPSDKHDLLEKLKKLSRKYPEEALGAYLELAQPEYEKERQKKLTEIATFIHAGQIEEAIAAAKGGLAK